MCPATVELAGDLTLSTAVWFPLQTHLPPACVLTDSGDLGWVRAEQERIKSQPSFGLCLWQMHSWLGSEQCPATASPPPGRLWRGGVRRARGWGAPSSASPWWRRGCLFKRSRGAGPGGLRARFHGTKAAGAAGPWGSQVSSRSRRSKGAHLAGPGASGAGPASAPELSQSAVLPSGAELLPRPAQGDAPRRPREPRTPTSVRRAQLLCRARTRGARVALGAQPGWRLMPLRPAEMTWRL
nr:uncharacterized protein LOC116147074 [Camelus dromedarius]